MTMAGASKSFIDMEPLERINKAAELILAADYLLVHTGAGMSADSGLPVYKDLQRVDAYLKRDLSYIELCEPHWCFHEPETFYGFWGSNLKMYRAAKPHEGYHIIKKWRDTLFSDAADFQAWYKINAPEGERPGPFFVNTSNVDTLHAKSGFNKCELWEVHGNIETWQCCRACKKESWKIPDDFSFKIDPTTMLAEEEEHPAKDYTKNNGFISNHPKCIYCGDYARPSILMFGDHHWIGNSSWWNPWKTNVHNSLHKNPGSSAVVLEIGCGKNVRTMRMMSEGFLDVAPRQIKLIRINQDFIYGDFTMNQEAVLGLEGSSLPILKALDEIIQRHLQEKATLQLANLQAIKLQQASLQMDEASGSDSEDEELAYEMKLRANLA